MLTSAPGLCGQRQGGAGGSSQTAKPRTAVRLPPNLNAGGGGGGPSAGPGPGQVGDGREEAQREETCLSYISCHYRVSPVPTYLGTTFQA